MKLNGIGRWILPFLITLSPLYGQDLELRLSQKQAFVGQPLTVELIFNGAENPGQPLFHSTDNYSVSYLGTSRNASVRVINGRRERMNQVIFRWQLIPSEEGTMEIPPFEVEINGSVKLSNGLTFSVREPGSLEGFELHQRAMQSMGFPGQALEMELVFSLQGRVNNLQFLIPYLKDPRFELQPLEPQAHQDIRVLEIQGVEFYCPVGAEYRDGVQYTTLTVPFAIIPHSSGMIDLPRVTLSFNEEVGTDAFMRPLYESRVLAGNPLSLDIQPLPEEVLNSANGIILSQGELQGSWEMLPRLLRVGDPLEMTLELRGVSSPKRVDMPSPEEFISLGEGMVFSTQSEIFHREEPGVIEISKRLRLTSPEPNIPPLEIVYFNLETGRGEILVLSPPEIRISDGGDLSPQLEQWENQQGQNPSPVREDQIPMRVNYSAEELLAMDGWNPSWEFPLAFLYLPGPLIFFILLLLPHVKGLAPRGKIPYPWEDAPGGAQALALFQRWAEQKGFHLSVNHQEQIRKLEQHYYGGGDSAADHWHELTELARELEDSNE